MKNNKAISVVLLLAAALLAGCATQEVHVKLGANKVRIVKNKPFPDYYEEVADITETDGHGCGLFGEEGSFANAENKLKNKAFSLGADIVQITDMQAPQRTEFCGAQDYTVAGVAYKYVANDQDDTTFLKVVEAYRTATPKPMLPEEARKFKVQAEVAVRDKKYADAAELYGEALKIAPWWPGGHFNRAIVLDESNYYMGHNGAIREMKRYLLLVPDASDARAAQNKIYEWELKVEK